MFTSDALVIYDYMDGEENAIRVFMESLQDGERGRLQAKIDVLRQNGLRLLGSKLLTPTRNRNIKEIRVNGRVAVRLLCCVGPLGGQTELTLLFGAFEKNNQYRPKNALNIADERRKRVLKDPENQRKKRS